MLYNELFFSTLSNIIRFSLTVAVFISNVKGILMIPETWTSEIHLRNNHLIFLSSENSSCENENEIKSTYMFTQHAYIHSNLNFFYGKTHCSFKKFKVIEMGGCQREECQTVCAESRRDDLCCLIGLCRMEQFSRAKNMSSLKSACVWVAARGHWVFSLVTGKERNFSRLFRHNGLDHADIVRKDARLCYIIS